VVKPAQRRALAQFVRVGFQVSERRAGRGMPVHRSPYRYCSVARDQTALRRRIRALAAVRVRDGARRRRVLRQRAGWQVHHQRV
jgi:putative transposase